MSSFLCFLCHSTVNADTNEEIREKYREVVGMHLCMDSHLCYICCHVLNKLWLFRAVCMKRSLEYPVLFSEKGTLNLQRNDLEFHTICSEDVCGQFHNRNVHSKSFHITYEDTNTSQSQEYVDNRYAKLEDDRTEFEDYFRQDEALSNNKLTNNSPENNVTNEGDIFNNYNTDIQHNEFINNSPENNITNEEEEEEMYNNYNTDNQPFVDDTHTVNVENNYLETYNTIEEETVNKEEYISEDFDNNKETDSKQTVKKKKSKKNKKKGYEKKVLSLEEQKAELDRRRKEKKYLEAEFKCYNCALGFLFKDTYQTHMMRHEESNGEFRCSTCTLRFATPAVLRAHVAHHAERYTCTRCSARVGPRARGTHARRCWGAGAEVACHLCGGMFQDGAGLQQHLKRFHQTKTSTRTYPCGVCGNTYADQAAVRTHMIKHINRKFNCTECSSIFSSPYTLAQHKKKKHGGAKTEQFYCEICNIGYCSKKSLLAHKRNALNHQQTIFECPICSRACPNQRSLASHVESVHSNSKNYACPVCSARYTNRKSLVRHIGAHQGKGQSKKVVCHLCGASFKGNNKLNRHLRQVCEKAKFEDEFANLYEQGCLNPG